MQKKLKNATNDTKRFFYSPITEDNIFISGQEAKHISRVLRLTIGDKLEFFDGNGTLAQGEIAEISKNEIEIAITSTEYFPKNKAQCPIIIAASVAKKDRFEWLISKCTELGVDQIYPAICERTVKQPGNEDKLLERYQSLAISAAKQSHNLYLPEIHKPMTIDDIITDVAGKYPEANIIIGSPANTACTITEGISYDKANIAFVGPEGGFTDDEIERLKDSGAKEIKMTNTILRIETAAIAFASVLCTLRDSHD